MKLIKHKDYILAVSDETPSTYIGYDVFTGVLKQLLKSECIESTKSIKRLISSERSRVIVAWHTTKNNRRAAELYGCSPKTFQRLLNTHVYE